MLKFEGIEVHVDYPMDETVYFGSTMAYAEFEVAGQPKEIPVHIHVEKKEGVFPYSIFQAKAEAVKDEYVLYVPVEHRGKAPHTRFKGKDNVDIILLSYTCKLKDLQVSVTTRNGRFFLNTQKIWSGTAAIAEEKEAGEVVCDFAPDEAAFNYPGSNYGNIWRGMAELIIGIIDESDMPVPKVAEVKVPRWEPARIPPQKDWHEGTVAYFNMVTGTGQLYRKGETFFVHFSTVVNGGPQGLLNPGSGVYFQTQVVQQNLQVKSVKAA